RLRLAGDRCPANTWHSGTQSGHDALLLEPSLDLTSTVGSSSDGGFSMLAGANADDVLDGQDEDLAVADATGACGPPDDFRGAFGLLVADAELDLDLGQEVHHVLGAAIQLGMSLLAAESLHLRDRHPLDPLASQSILHLVELERLDDGLDLVHATPPT